MSVTSRRRKAIEQGEAVESARELTELINDVKKNGIGFGSDALSPSMHAFDFWGRPLYPARVSRSSLELNDRDYHFF